MIWHASQRRLIEDFLQDNLSEWLRRQTRNLLGFARAGSNPADVAFFLYCHSTVIQGVREHVQRKPSVI